MRIISGKFKKRRLKSIRGMNIRPTSDALRESLFNILGSMVEGAVVLDLFAGTGALAIEAMSRGAESAVLVDLSNQALSIIRENIKICALENNVKLIKWNILKNLNCLKLGCFDLVFIDPPYNKKFLQPALYNLYNTECLAQNACIIVEHSVQESLPNNLNEFELVKQRKYGKTIISFLNLRCQ
ncbi:16S rRNA (guanine966-N2)-methyltransferase [Candidatus Magnetomoraceae bacterium gMMP-15]